MHWDHFHRLDHAGNNAIRASVPATEVMQLLHDLEANFGHGQGRALHRGVNDFIGAPQLSHMYPGGCVAEKFFFRVVVKPRTVLRYRFYFSEHFCLEHVVAYSSGWGSSTIAEPRRSTGL